MLPPDTPRDDHDDRADLLRVGVDDRGDGFHVVALSGEVDLHTSGLLRDALERVLAAEPNVIIVDMTGVEFLSSSGLSALAGLVRAIGPRAIDVRLVGGGRVVVRPIRAAGLEDLFTWHESVADALRNHVG